MMGRFQIFFILVVCVFVATTQPAAPINQDDINVPVPSISSDVQSAAQSFLERIRAARVNRQPSQDIIDHHRHLVIDIPAPSQVLSSNDGLAPVAHVDGAESPVPSQQQQRDENDDAQCWESGVHYDGNDLKEPFASPSTSGCQRECIEDPACDFFTYDRTQGLCWLKKGSMTPSAATQQADNVSGPRGCLECWEKVGYWGNDILPSPMIADSALQCQLHCRSEPECNFFSFNPSESLCWLKSERGMKWTAERLSGPKICPAPQCWRDGIGYWGADISTPVEVDSVEACQTSCVRLAGCKFFTFNKLNGLCWLKSETGMIWRNEHRVSGPRSCSQQQQQQPQ